MGSSNSIIAYDREKDILERALATERGLRLIHETPSKATEFVHRCNKFRVLDRRRNAKIYTEPAHEMHMASVYDRLQLKRDKENPLVVTIEKLPETETKATVEEL